MTPLLLQVVSLGHQEVEMRTPSSVAHASSHGLEPKDEKGHELGDSDQYSDELGDDDEEPGPHPPSHTPPRAARARVRPKNVAAAMPCKPHRSRTASAGAMPMLRLRTGKSCANAPQPPATHRDQSWPTPRAPNSKPPS